MFDDIRVLSVNPLSDADVSKVVHLQKSENALDCMETLIADLSTLARQGQVVNETKSVELPRIVRQAWSSVDTRESVLVVDKLSTLDADPGRL